MRLLFLVGRDALHPGAGGGDPQAWEWAKWASRQGHEVTFVCQSHDSLPATEIRDGIEVLRLGTGARLAVRAFRYYRSRHKVFDVLYEDPIGGGRIPYFSPLYSRVPLVAVWHQVSGPLLRALHPRPVAAALTLAERLLARIYRRCLVWVPSEERAEEVATALGLDRSRIAVIPPTLAVDIGEPMAREERDPVILFVGVLRRYKAVEHVIQALPKVLPRVPAARLIIVGRPMDAGYEMYLRRLVEELGVEKHVTFALGVSDTEKHRMMRAATVLVLPSSLEGFGIVTMEAGAAGTPVIASSGVPEAAVRHDHNGLRYPYGDVEALAAGITTIMLDDAVHARLVDGGQRTARTFTSESVGIKFAELLHRAAHRTKARRKGRFGLASPETKVHHGSGPTSADASARK